MQLLIVHDDAKAIRAVRTVPNQIAVFTSPLLQSALTAVFGESTGGIPN
jgi:hypothetical protein